MLNLEFKVEMLPRTRSKGNVEMLKVEMLKVGEAKC